MHSLQRTVIEVLMEKLKGSMIWVSKTIALAEVFLQIAVYKRLKNYAQKCGWNVFVPKFSYTTDNAAMVAITGLFKYKDNDFSDIASVPFSKITIQ